ncbi:hypothetical protein SKB0120_05550 [Moraxella osloensis]
MLNWVTTMLTNTVSEEENRLFRLILDSIGLEEDVSYFVNNVSQMTSKQVLDLLENLDTDDKRLNLLFEALLLARIHSPITDTQLKVLDEICSLFELDQDDIKLLIFWLKIVMGLDNLELADRLNEIPSNFIEIQTQAYDADKLRTFVKPYKFVLKDTVLGNYLKIKKIVFTEEIEKKKIRGSWLFGNSCSVEYWNVNANSSFLKDRSLAALTLSGRDDYYYIQAPFDGVMINILKKPKEYLNVNDVLCTIREHESAREKYNFQPLGSGILIDIYQNPENHIEYQILPLPTYLNNWAKSIQSFIEG